MLRPLLALVLCSSLVVAAEGWPNVPRKLPPVGKELPEAEAKRLRATVDELSAALARQSAPLSADVAIFTKAVDLALRHREFYDVGKDVAKADWALTQARERLDKLKAAPWTSQRGGVVRGYVSSIDDS